MTSAPPPFRPSALPPCRPSALPPFRPSALPPFRPQVRVAAGQEHLVTPRMSFKLHQALVMPGCWLRTSVRLLSRAGRRAEAGAVRESKRGREETEEAGLEHPPPLSRASWDCPSCRFNTRGVHTRGSGRAESIRG
jgi:hypothetical protein